MIIFKEKSNSTSILNTNFENAQRKLKNKCSKNKCSIDSTFSREILSVLQEIPIKNVITFPTDFLKKIHKCSFDNWIDKKKIYALCIKLICMPPHPEFWKIEYDEKINQLPLQHELDEESINRLVTVGNILQPIHKCQEVRNFFSTFPKKHSNDVRPGYAENVKGSLDNVFGHQLVPEDFYPKEKSAKIAQKLKTHLEAPPKFIYTQEIPIEHCSVTWHLKSLREFQIRPESSPNLIYCIQSSLEEVFSNTSFLREIANTSDVLAPTQQTLFLKRLFSKELGLPKMVKHVYKYDLVFRSLIDFLEEKRDPAEFFKIFMKYFKITLQERIFKGFKFAELEHFFSMLFPDLHANDMLINKCFTFDENFKPNGLEDFAFWQMLAHFDLVHLRDAPIEEAMQGNKRALEVLEEEEENSKKQKVSSSEVSLPEVSLPEVSLGEVQEANPYLNEFLNSSTRLGMLFGARFQGEENSR